MEHSPLPWTVELHDKSEPDSDVFNIFDANGIPLECDPYDGLAEEDQRFIVASVNATLGIAWTSTDVAPPKEGQYLVLCHPIGKDDSFCTSAFYDSKLGWIITPDGWEKDITHWKREG